MVPVKNGKIDFEFIESFVAELEAYLNVTGLKDYELTNEEKEALEKYNSINWTEYSVDDLFEVNSYKKRFDANKTTIFKNGKYPYVVRTAYNNGIKGYITEKEDYLNPGNTISFGQDTATMWYQEKPYFTGDKIKILAPKFEEFKKENAHFIITAMSKAFKNFSWGYSSFNVDLIKMQELMLPTYGNGKIDFDYMENLIQAIKKLIIKDVVIYTDKKIKATKKILNIK